MTKAIADNTKTLATVAKDIGSLTPKGMAVDIGVPFHAGNSWSRATGIGITLILSVLVLSLRLRCCSKAWSAS